MKIEYDTEVDAIYIRIQEKEVAHTKEIEEWKNHWDICRMRKRHWIALLSKTIITRILSLYGRRLAQHIWLSWRQSMKRCWKKVWGKKNCQSPPINTGIHYENILPFMMGNSWGALSVSMICYILPDTIGDSSIMWRWWKISLKLQSNLSISLRNNEGINIGVQVTNLIV